MKEEKLKTTVPLFDIDHTLLKVENRGSGGSAFEYAVKKTLGLDVSINKLSGHGMIDPQIFRELLEVNGHGHLEITPEHRENLFKAREEHFFAPVEIKTTYITMPGAPGLLERLSQEGYLMGVLTGNLENVGRAKLREVFLEKHFAFGLFSNTVDKRSELSELAKIEVRKYFPPDVAPKLIVIGDTPLDIAAAHEAGLPAIGVGAGKFSVDQLKEAGAEGVIKSLEQEDEFIALMEEVANKN